MATTSMNNPQKHAEQKMKTIVIFDLSFNFISTNGSLQISKAEYGTMDLDHLWEKIKTVL